MAKPKTKTVLKKKKKILFKIVAPKVLNEAEIGEIEVFTPESLIGRTVEVNLMNLTMNIRKQHYKVKFMITDVDGSIARTKPIGFTMMNSAVKRISRRGRDKIEDSFTVFSKDKVFIRIKPLLITLNNISSSLRTTIRKSVQFYVKKYFEEHNYNTFVKELIAGSFQADVAKFMSKIYPIKTSEIKAMKIEKLKQTIKTKEGEVISQVSGMEEKLDKEVKEPQRRRRGPPRRRPQRDGEEIRRPAEAKREESKPEKAPAETQEKNLKKRANKP